MIENLPLQIHKNFSYYFINSIEILKNKEISVYSERIVGGRVKIRFDDILM